MLEISEQQKIVLTQMNKIIDDYCTELTNAGTPFDKELIHGIVNRLISVQLEKTVAADRQRNSSRTSTGKLNGNKSTSVPQVSFLKPRSSIEPIKTVELPKPKHFKRALNKSAKSSPPSSKIESSPKVNNSRMNLLEALKKAREESATKNNKDDDEEKASEDTGSELSFSDLKNDSEPHVNDTSEQEPDLQFVGTVEYTPEVSMSRRKRKTAHPILIDADVVTTETTVKPAVVAQLDISNGSESSGKSSRRSSDVEAEMVPKQETEISNLGQVKYLRYFNLLTHDELKMYQSRRISRRKRNCTSTNRKDFHYGAYDIDYQPVKLHSNKPVLFSPSKSKRNKPPIDPLAMPEMPIVPKRARLQPLPPPPPAPVIVPIQVNDKVKPKPIGIMNVPKRATKQTAPLREQKPCITCSRMEDVDKMNACLICYNFYHLTCHTLQRELRERENMCPGCLKRIVEKRKKQLELKRMLKVQVLQANHKARVLQSKQMIQKG